jgi:PAS domain S-box-containing protein
MVPKARILIVEDDGVTALNIRTRLCQSGYVVLAIAESANQAIDYVEITYANEHIDLVLMDIQLKGNKDGIAAAQEIQERFNIPVVYLTATADTTTIDRAKLTQPYGYVIKPFQAADLLSAIEIALYKHKVDQQLKEREQWLLATLRSIGDAVITTDANGKITFMNPLAEQLAACPWSGCTGESLADIMNLIDSQTNLPCSHIVSETLEQGISVTSKHYAWLNNCQGKSIPIDYQISPIRNGRAEITGSVLVFRDISERLEAEIALQKNEARYRTLYRDTPVMMYSIDHNLEIVDISDYCLRKLGYAREEMMGRKSVEFLTENARRFAQEVGFAKFFKAGFCEDVPLQYICKDGKVIDVLLSAIIERDDTGKMVRTLTVLNDITERKAAEVALRKSEATQRSILSAIPDLLIRADREGCYLNVISGGEVDLIQDIEMMNQTSVYEILPPHLAEQRVQFIKTALATGEKQIYEYEIEIRGKVYHEEARIEVSGENEVLIIVRDISDRKVAEAALRRSESKFRRLAEAGVIGVIVGDVEGKVLYVNDYFLDMLGYEQAEFETNQIDWLRITPPEDLAKDVEAIKQIHEYGRSYSYEKEYIHKNGQRVPVLIGVTKLEGYEVRTGIGFVLDLSDRKRIERELHDLNQQLEQKVAERTADLQKVNTRLMFEVAERTKAEKSLTKYLGKLQCLQETIFELSCAETLEHLYEIAIANTETILGTHRASLGLTHENSSQLYYATSKGISEQYRHNVGQVLSRASEIFSESMIVCNDVSEESQLKPVLPFLQEEGISSLAWFPLEYQEKLIGKLVIYYDQLNGFVKEDIDLASALATSLAVAISRKRTELALRDREQQYRSLVDNVPGAIYRFFPDQDYTIQFISDEIEKIVGYPSADFVNNYVRRFIDIVYPQDLSWVLDEVNQAIALRKPFELEYRLVAADGGIKWVYEKGQGYFDEDDELAYLDGAIFDISVRKKLEAEQLLYAERLQNLYQTAFELGRAQDLDQLYATALTGVRQTLKCDRLAILILSPTNQWQMALTEGLSEQHSQLIENCLNAKSATACANAHELGVKLYPDIKTSPLPKPLLELSLAEGIASIGVAWIKSQDQVLGQVAFHYDQLHQFSEQEIQLVDTLATYIGIAITRKLAEQALSASEARYRSLVGNISGAIYRCNVIEQGRKPEFVSDAIEDICGYPPDYFTGANGTSLLSLIHPDDRVKVSQEAQIALEENCPYELEYRIIDANGRVRWVLDRGIGIYDPDGNCCYEDGVIFDISDRKATEEELRQSKATQQAIIDTIPDLLVRMHRNGDYISIMSGGEVTVLNQELMQPGVNLRSAASAEFTAERLRYIERALDTQELQIYEYQISVQGKVRDEEARIVPFGSDISDEVLVMVRDITDRKQAERSLKDSEQKYRVLFNSIGDPVFVHGHDQNVPTKFVEVNDLACESLGYTRAELSQMTVKDILPSDFKYDPQAIADFLRDREAIFKVEHVHKSGKRFPVEVSARAFDLAGKLMVVGIARDVSEHKRIETGLLSAYKKEKELAELRSKFISMVSHEFRTPMSTILLSIDLLQHKSINWDLEKKQIRFERIRQGIKRIDSLIEDVLVMGKMDSGNMKFQPAPVDLIALCLGIVEEAQISTTKHQISTKVADLAVSEILNYAEAEDDERIPAEPNHAPLVSSIDSVPDYAQIVHHLQNAYMDEKLLQHILTNLLFNAVKYSPQGGDVELSILFQTFPDGQLPPELLEASKRASKAHQPDYLLKSMSGEIDKKKDEKDTPLMDIDVIGTVHPQKAPQFITIGMVTISISDSGIGIEPKDLELLFDAFHRGQNVSNAPGTGLGLAIVKNAVDLHRGHISASSEVNVGTTFTVKLPVYEPVDDLES